MRARTIFGLGAALVVVAAIGVVIGWHAVKEGLPGLPIKIRSEYCTAEADGAVTLTLDQMANAATIAAVGIRRDVPERAITIAMATALQESKLRNVPDGEGDRDSVGLFQQRPSQGWGTAAQIADPRYAAGRFYSALLHVKNWQTKTITDAAQSVQHSAAPYAYQKWAVEAQVLASALMGDDEAAVACNVGATPATTGPTALSGLATGLRRDWGDLVRSLTTTAPDRLTLAVADPRVGWQYAHWLVAHAQDNGIRQVQFAGLAWTAQGGVWIAAPAHTASATAGNTDVVAQVFSSQ